MLYPEKKLELRIHLFGKKVRYIIADLLKKVRTFQFRVDIRVKSCSRNAGHSTKDGLLIVCFENIFNIIPYTFHKLQESFRCESVGKYSEHIFQHNQEIADVRNQFQ